MKKSNSEILENSRNFLQNAKSLVLATTDSEGAPLASYAPFVRDEEGALYVFVSGLAQHSANLANGKTSAMVIEDEGDVRQIFARNRLTFECRVEEIARDLPLATEILNLFRERHGPVIKMLSSLPDFILYRLTPAKGVYVTGFGKAYDVNPQLSALLHIDPRRS